MKPTAKIEGVLTNVLVPRSLVDKPDRFGGAGHGGCLSGDLVIEHGRAVRLRSTASGHETRSDPRMVIPKLTEAHIHLDKCYTAHRMGVIDGDLREAIAAQHDDKALWTNEDIRRRGESGLRELVDAGCKTIRSHVDWTYGSDAINPPAAWSVLLELAQDHRQSVDLQLAPLVSVEDFADADKARTIAKTVAQAGAALGCFVYDQPEREAGIRAAFAMADTYGLPLDFHVDEGLEAGLDGLSIIADVALEADFQGPILCGHCCSLMNLHGEDLSRLLDKVARAGIAVAALPATNLYLQGRTAGTPDRRGIARLRELNSAGVVTVIGTDNVSDAFCPVGRFDPLNSLSLAILSAHLAPPIGDALQLVTVNAEKAMGKPQTWVDVASLDDLLIFEVASTAELVAGAGERLQFSNCLDDAIQGART